MSKFRNLANKFALQFCACLAISLPSACYSQLSALHSDTIRGNAGDTIKLSQKFLVPHSESVSADNRLLESWQYSLIPLRGIIILLDNNLNDKAVIVNYRHFLRFLGTSYAFRSEQTGKQRADSAGYISPRYRDNPGIVFGESSVTKSGSISRGLTIGNNQSLSVTSGLRLQIDGDIGDGTKISAAITDDNIPIQPDGTTQQIQDFDKVFIRIQRDMHYIILGDYEISHTGTFFSNFYRNVQGMGVNYLGDDVQVSVNGAQAKGKFHTNSFQGKENVLGPYRLTGRNNERFIIILAGSEKVYLNGSLLKRGEGNDYTMDYNTGELYFTSQQVINSVSRIVVDFEYSDRFYNRSLLFAKANTKLFDDKLDLQLTYARDADNHNAPIDLSFSDDDRDTLRNAGDDPLKAYSNGVDSVGFLLNAIRYERKDTTIDSVTYERYVISTNPSTAIYDISFAAAGTGNGMYIKSNDPVNGTIFEWMAPDSLGNPLGDYLPVKILNLPKLLQVFDLKAGYKIADHINLYSETAISGDDKNRFSALDDDDNQDIANKSGFKIRDVRIGDSLRFHADVSHKYVGEKFRNIDRINKIEYGREWNFDDLATQQMENVSEAVVELNDRKRFHLLANAGIRRMGTGFISVKELFSAESSHKLLQGKYTFTNVSSDDRAAGKFSSWQRHNGDIYKRIGSLQPGTELWMENKRTDIGDSAAAGTFRFLDVKPYLKTVKSEAISLHAWYNFRKEQEFNSGLYREKSLAHTEYLKLVLNPTSGFNLQSTTSYRDFRLQDTTFKASGLQDSKTFITNFQASVSPPNRIVYANMIYEVTSEQLARKQEAYLLVNPGAGQYVWNDTNLNGEQELEEFQLAPGPLLGDYIRVVIPTQELFSTTGVNSGFNLKIDLKQGWKRSESPVKEIARNMLLISNFRVSQKKEAGNDAEDYLVDLTKIFADTSLLESRYTHKQELWFFRNHSRGDLMFGFNDNKSKQFLFTGTESRGNSFWESRQRVNFGKAVSIENSFTSGEKITESENIVNRNFNIRYTEINPRINMQISRKFRTSLGYEWKDKSAVGDTGVIKSAVMFHKAVLDMRINLKARNNLFAKVELVQISQTGEAGNSENYELRETLEPGFNLVAQAFATWYLSDNLELSLNYDLRMPNGKPPVNTGRIQLKAFF